MGSAKQKQDITIQISRRFKGINVSVQKLKGLAKVICGRFGLSGATISIAIIGDGEMRRLNRRFLGCMRCTDVLSFDLSDEDQKIFELVVNGALAEREGKRRGHCGEAELALYITHGLLHQLGFDDCTAGRARRMHDTEDEILQQFGYGMVYNRNNRISNIE